MKDFRRIEYLQLGNSRQKQAYAELKKIRIFEILQDYDPVLTGTIPIEIDLPGSDLDIICECENHIEFSNLLFKEFGNEKEFELKSRNWSGIRSTIATFKAEKFEIEIFGQNVPTGQQNAYKHMLIEANILAKKGPDFKSQIKELKAGGLKTEPAFAKLLGLKGNPYDALLRIEV